MKDRQTHDFKQSEINSDRAQGRNGDEWEGSGAGQVHAPSSQGSFPYAETHLRPEKSRASVQHTKRPS